MSLHVLIIREIPAFPPLTRQMRSAAASLLSRISVESSARSSAVGCGCARRKSAASQTFTVDSEKAVRLALDPVIAPVLRLMSAHV